MNDVECVILTVLFLITQHRTATTTEKLARETWKKDAGRVRKKGEWIKHPDVELDANISVFYDVLVDWADRRREGPLPSGVTDPVTWPAYEKPPEDPVTFVEKYSYRIEANVAGRGRLVDRIRAGRPVLNWVRPITSKLDPNRPILATGRYADEEPVIEFTQVPDPSRGFPQAPLGIDGLKRQGTTTSSHEVGGGDGTGLKRKRDRWEV
ncbi:hypothetical protein B0T14DRAFT_259464 [Immersiella caudata]|uniref:Uncharacterized protein n=1 Tax=Immersiella caudata TaxID=314043 RepID=A0AA40BXD4_9PEZI|nr:hypothetical protein B0T14DRAFT_259464 [Immersiella caudata]